MVKSGLESGLPSEPSELVECLLSTIDAQVTQSLAPALQDMIRAGVMLSILDLSKNVKIDEETRKTLEASLNDEDPDDPFAFQRKMLIAYRNKIDRDAKEE